MKYAKMDLAATAGPAMLAARTRSAGAAARSSPALALYTDFHVTQPMTVSRTTQIDVALQDMMRCGVRAFVVIDEGLVAGLVTAYDIQSEKPLQALKAGECLKDSCLRRDVLVEDIMTPLEVLPTLSLGLLAAATIGDLEATFAATDQSHLLVVERNGGGTVVCGIVSRTQLASALGAAGSDGAQTELSEPNPIGRRARG